MRSELDSVIVETGCRIYINSVLPSSLFIAQTLIFSDFKFLKIPVHHIVRHLTVYSLANHFTVFGQLHWNIFMQPRVFYDYTTTDKVTRYRELCNFCKFPYLTPNTFFIEKALERREILPHHYRVNLTTTSHLYILTQPNLS